jgi:predicted HTH transcriptional regulator
VKAVLHVKRHGSIGNEEFQQLTGARGRAVTLELGDLVERGVLERIGTPVRGTCYAARKA